MELWQEKLLKKIFHKDFLEDKEIIGTAFQEVCKPVEGKGGKQNKCKYNGIIDKDDEYYCTFELELQTHTYQLTVFNDKLRLLFGEKTTYYQEEKLLAPMCRIEYHIEKGQEKYTINVLNKENFETFIEESVENKIFKEVTKVSDFTFDNNKYKKIINNILNIATTGMFEGTYIFKKELKEITIEKNIIDPFEV